MIAFILPYRYLEGLEGRLERTIQQLSCSLQLGDFIVLSDLTGQPEWNRARAINKGIERAKTARVKWVCVMSLDLECLDLPERLNGLLTAYQWAEHYYIFDVRQGTEPHFGDNWGGDIALFPITLWESVGGFDEHFTGYGYEDRDFYERVLPAVRQTGIQIQHIPHPQCPTINEDLERNRALFERKWNHA